MSLSRVFGRVIAFLIALWRKADVKGIDMKHKEVVDGGEFTVTGAGSAGIKLPGRKRPHDIHVEVEFDGNCLPLVCNPHHFDKLWWEIKEACYDDPYRGHHPNKDPERYELWINWHVSGLRMIKWSIRYKE